MAGGGPRPVTEPWDWTRGGNCGRRGGAVVGTLVFGWTDEGGAETVAETGCGMGTEVGGLVVGDTLDGAI